MSSHDKPIIEQTSPDTSLNVPQFNVKAFEESIYEHGLDCLLERALKCPCRNEANDGALSDCKNCGGSGWLFVNKRSTRMVFQGVNRDTKFKQWTEDDRGTVKISARPDDKLAFMDRVTILSLETTYQQVIHMRKYLDNWVGALLYTPLEIEFAHLFINSDTKLQALEKDADYTISGQILTLDSDLEFTQTLEDAFDITIRYSHYPTYNVLDIPRERSTAMKTMKDFNSDVKLNSITSLDPSSLPINAIARKSHYVMDAPNLAGEGLFDNSVEGVGAVMSVCDIINSKLSKSDRDVCILPLMDFGDPITYSHLSEEQKADVLAASPSSDPLEDNVRDGIAYEIEGIELEGNLVVPSANNLRSGIGAGTNGTEVIGNIQLAPANKIIVGTGNGSNGTEITGNVVLPDESEVEDGVGFGANGTEFTGNLVVVTPSGIAYQKPIYTQVSSINNYDEAWLLANGVFDYTPPIFPISYARLDLDSVSPETTLVYNNAFGNKNRFTDSVGAQNYNGTGGSLVGYYIDHLTGIGYYNVFQDSASFADACSLAYNSTALGLSGWHLPTINELIIITKHTSGSNRLALIGNGGAGSLVTSTTLQDNQYYHIYSTNFNGNMSTRGTVASGSNQYIICRNHYN